MPWQGPLGARRCLRHIHDPGDRGSARLGTGSAEALSGTNVRTVRTYGCIRRGVAALSTADSARLVDVDADAGAYAYHARHAIAGNVARNDQAHDLRHVRS